MAFGQAARVEIGVGGKLVMFEGPGDKGGDRIVTRLAPAFLFYPCTLQEGVTVGDVFRLMKRHLTLLAPMYGRWCRMIVTEGLLPRRQSKKDPRRYKSVVLGWSLTSIEDQETRLPVVRGLRGPAAWGTGKLLGAVKGETRFGLNGAKAYDLAPVPLQLSSDLKFGYYLVEPAKDKLMPGAEFRLCDVFAGVVGPLAWGMFADERQKEAKRKKSVPVEFTITFGNGGLKVGHELRKGKATKG